MEISDLITKQIEDYLLNRPDIAKALKLYVPVDSPAWLTRQILLNFKEEDLKALPPIAPLIATVMTIVEVFLKGKAYSHDTQPGPTT